MNWVLIVAALIALFLFLRFRELRHRVTHIVIILMIVLVVGSIVTVYLSNDVDLTSFDGIAEAGKLYFNWLGTVFGNVGKVSSYAVQQDWSAPTSEQNETAAEPS